MKRILIFFLIMIATVVSFALAQASDDISQTPEIQFTSTPSDPGTDATDLYNMAWKLNTPVAIYEYVRNNAVYALYHGSRSNSINTYLGLRGNDVDIASTLIALCRAIGIHSRYAVGTVKVGAGQVMNWLGVTNINLAVSIMQDQGIQNVSLSSDNSYVSFEHVWVEAYLPYWDYRGAGANSCTYCGGSGYHWVDLDPSFKQYQYNQPSVDVYSTLPFNYTNYYNAIKNGDATQINKNPLEIYQNQVLIYLQTNYPGKTLDDVAYTGTIITQNDLILPASLPYTVVGHPRWYNSVADHDAAVPATEPQKWAKNLTAQFNMTVTPSGGGTINFSLNMGPVLLADLSTKKLTLTTEIDGGIPNVVLYLDGVEIARPLAGNGTISGYTPKIGDPFSLTVTMDGVPGGNPIQATYSSCIVGGYYLLATGGETSNWTQVHRAAQELLQANQQYPMVFNPAENGSSDGCNTATGLNCTPYIDSSGVYQSGDPTLLNDKPALDALTGGLLYVAAMQYYATLHDDM